MFRLILLNTKYCNHTFVNIKNIGDIKNTKADDIICFEFDEELCLYAKNNNLSYMVSIKDIKESILANHLNARYILLKNAKIKEIEKYMKIAQNYLFDSKIICQIYTIDKINKIAKTNIDGIFLENKENK